MAARLSSLLFLALLSVWASGCSTSAAGNARRFEHGRDGFAFRNGLSWTYTFNEDGSWHARKAEPRPNYSLHCFPMVRAAREFLYHARFDPARPKTSQEEYQRLIRMVTARDSRRPAPLEDRIVFPGYGSLAEFSAEYGELLKEECGSTWNSYTQRGNWRMVFPFSRGHQERMAARLQQQIDEGLAPAVHLVDFPELKINHGVLLTEARISGKGTLFLAYDPNNPDRAAELRFDALERRFYFERNEYFPGGPVNVYEVYRNALF